MKFEEKEISIVLPNIQRPIVYFLLYNDEVVYVGQSKVGLARPYVHSDKKFNNVAVIKCNEEDLDFIETKYIIKYNPKYNQNTGNFISSPKRIAKFIRSHSKMENLNANDVKKIIELLDIKLFVAKGDLCVECEDFEKIIQFVNSTSENIFSITEWRRKVFR